MTERGAHLRALGATLACAAFALHAPAETARSADFAPAAPETWRLETADLLAVTSRGSSAWAVGYWGTVLRSTDAGKSWTLTRTPTRAALFGVAFGDEKNGWAVGERGVILHSTDGGATWSQQLAQTTDELGETQPLGVNLMAIAALSATEAWVVGDLGTVLRTRDGATWQSVKFGASVLTDDNPLDRVFNAVAFASPTEGYIAGEFATLLRTRDAGDSWLAEHTLEGAPEDLYLFALAADAGGRAAASGLAGGVIATDDGGTLWQSKSVDTRAGLFSIAWRGQRGIVVGDRGVIYATADGGATWVDPVRPSHFNWFAGAIFLDDARALAVGEGGLILQSGDGGQSWSAARVPAERTKLAGDPGALGGELSPPASPKAPQP